MVVLLNGAFGIGKTSVARRLRRRLPGSAIYDPELAGLVLRRLPSWIPLEGRGTDDAHGSAGFAEHVPAEDGTPEQIAAEIAALISGGGLARPADPLHSASRAGERGR